MTEEATIHFLHHSGFAMDLSDAVLVFDYYKDPEGVLDRLLAVSEKPLYFFVSHVHGDHFNPEAISAYKDRASGYFLHEDCRRPEGYFGSRAVYMEKGDTASAAEFSVAMTGSTDTGGSYWISWKGFSLFHAGDLNWWHWAGEKDEDNREARAMYFKELSDLSGRAADLAFFPVDARQEVAREWGVTAFLEAVPVKCLIPMHAFGSRWNPSYTFRWRFPGLPLWIPEKDGTSFHLTLMKS